jgi:hypothetical protein
MPTIELTGDQIDEVVHEELTYLMGRLADPVLREHVAAVLDYYSVPSLEEPNKEKII